MSAQRLPITYAPDSEELKTFKEARRAEALKLAEAGRTDITDGIPNKYLIEAYRRHYIRTNEHLEYEGKTILDPAKRPSRIEARYKISSEDSKEPLTVVTFRKARVDEARQLLIKEKPAYKKIDHVPAEILGRYVSYAYKQHYAATGEKLIFNPITQQYAISGESEEVMAFREARNAEGKEIGKADSARALQAAKKGKEYCQLDNGFGQSVFVAYDQHYRETGENLEFDPEANQYAVSKTKDWVPKKVSGNLSQGSSLESLQTKSSTSPFPSTEAFPKTLSSTTSLGGEEKSKHGSKGWSLRERKKSIESKPITELSPYTKRERNSNGGQDRPPSF